jgi:hypothetical protein
MTPFDDISILEAVLRADLHALFSSDVLAWLASFFA